MTLCSCVRIQYRKPLENRLSTFRDLREKQTDTQTHRHTHCFIILVRLSSLRGQYHRIGFIKSNDIRVIALEGL